MSDRDRNKKAPRPADEESAPGGNCCPNDSKPCDHPKESRVMRGWTQVCMLCGLGREIG